MDDVTLGGSESTVAGDITTISNIGPSYGLQLNTSKCEAISNTGAVSHDLLAGFEQKTTESSTLLGALLSTGTAIADCLLTRCADVGCQDSHLTVKRLVNFIKVPARIFPIPFL